MGTGKYQKFSPIVRAIEEAEKGTTAEIRVHLSRRWIEHDAFRRASRLFKRFGMYQTENRNAVLLYVNLRRHQFAVIGDQGIHQRVGQRYWESLAYELRQNLRSTHPENAIALAVRNIGKILQKHFPLDRPDGNANELPNDVTED